METNNTNFRNETSLVDSICLVLQAGETRWGTVKVGREFGFGNGRTDVIAVDSQNSVVAFEAKLVKWREALQQAYRSTSFAAESYVVLPSDVAKYAAKFTAEFSRRSVGLCSASQHGLEILIESKTSQPIQPWLTDAAIEHSSRSIDGCK